MEKRKQVLYCHCAYSDVVPQEVKDAVLGYLSTSGLPVHAVSDLCQRVAGKDPLLEQISRGESVTIVACYSRTVKWLFHAAGAPLSEQAVTILNMRTDSAESIIESLRAESDISQETDVVLDEKEEWVPWFPVIDYDRCRGCRQCLNFCFFGVYGMSESGDVEVRNPEKCKTNCPACARICPDIAIIFPKYKSGPICGADVDEENLEGDALQVDFSSLADTDVYATLRQRGQGERQRFSTDKRMGGSVEKMTQALDIPREVIESMSPSEIQQILKTCTKPTTPKADQDPPNGFGE